MKQELIFCDLCGKECGGEGEAVSYSAFAHGERILSEFHLCAERDRPDFIGAVVGGCAIRLADVLEAARGVVT